MDKAVVKNQNNVNWLFFMLTFNYQRRVLDDNLKYEHFEAFIFLAVNNRN